MINFVKFLSLLFRVRIKAHFQLKNPITCREGPRAKPYRMLLSGGHFSQDHHRVIDKYGEGYIIADWCKISLVWTLIYCERLFYFLWKIRTYCYRLVVLVSYQKQAVMKSDNRFLLAVCHFAWIFHSTGYFPLSMHDLNVSSKGFKTESPQSFSMRILSCQSSGLYSN